MLTRRSAGLSGESSVGETKLILDVGMERGGIWRLVNGGDGAAFEQARSHQVSKAQGEQARPAVAGGNAQVGEHRGKNFASEWRFRNGRESVGF